MRRISWRGAVRTACFLAIPLTFSSCIERENVAQAGKNFSVIVTPPAPTSNVYTAVISYQQVSGPYAGTIKDYNPSIVGIGYGKVRISANLPGTLCRTMVWNGTRINAGISVGVYYTNVPSAQRIETFADDVWVGWDCGQVLNWGS